MFFSSVLKIYMYLSKPLNQHKYYCNQRLKYINSILCLAPSVKSDRKFNMLQIQSFRTIYSYRHTLVIPQYCNKGTVPSVKFQYRSTLGNGTDRQTHAQTHECSALVPHTRYTRKKIACEVLSSWTVDQTKLSCLILLRTLPHSRRWIQYIGDSHLKQTSDYRKARKLLPGASRPKKRKTTTNRTYSWQFRCINSINIILLSNGLIYVYIVGIRVKRIVMSCFT